MGGEAVGSVSLRAVSLLPARFSFSRTKRYKRRREARLGRSTAWRQRGRQTPQIQLENFIISVAVLLVLHILGIFLP